MYRCNGLKNQVESGLRVAKSMAALKSAFCGGHVKSRGKPSKVFIIPLCRSCNAPKKKSWMKFDKDTKAVSVTKKILADLNFVLLNTCKT